MERLTKIFEDGPIKVLTICQARCGDAIVWREWSISKDAAIEESLMRLAAYEDTGMEPEEIKELSELKTSLTAAEQNMLNDYLGLGSVARLRELAEADRDGRCVVLPCKVGDICYEVDPGHPGVIEHTVTATTIYSKKADGKRYMEDFSNLLVIETYAVAEDGCEWTDQYTAKEWADAPKTRPEAEAALNDAHKPGGEQT